MIAGEREGASRLKALTVACSSPSQSVGGTVVGLWWLLDAGFLIFLGGHATGRIWVIRTMVPIIFFLPFSCVFCSFFFLTSFFSLFFYLFSLLFFNQKLPKKRSQAIKGAWVASQEALI